MASREKHTLNNFSVNAENSSQGPEAFACLFKPFHILHVLFRGQFSWGRWNSYAPTFPIHISDVVDHRPEKQVRRIDARWNIAVVQDVEVIRNSSVRQLPRNSMREHLSRLTAKAYQAIAFVVLVGGPNPAAESFTNLGPETELQ